MKFLKKKARPLKATESVKKNVYDLYLKKEPLTEIAYKNNISVSTVNKIIKEQKNLHNAE